ncbi:hypothetical protein ACJX0J_031475 [Zea mays]
MGEFLHTTKRHMILGFICRPFIVYKNKKDYSLLQHIHMHLMQRVFIKSMHEEKEVHAYVRGPENNIIWKHPTDGSYFMYCNLATIFIIFYCCDPKDCLFFLACCDCLDEIENMYLNQYFGDLPYHERKIACLISSTPINLKEKKLASEFWHKSNNNYFWLLYAFQSI